MSQNPRRKEFERAELVLAKDGMYANPKAEKDCRTCNGHGIVDTGMDYGVCLIRCPDCWMPHAEPRTAAGSLD